MKELSIEDPGQKTPEIQGVTKKNKLIRNLKFLLIPGWRDPEFTVREYEIEKIKSKRRFFRKLLNPLTIIGFFLILFILFCAVYAPFLTPYTIDRVTDGGVSGGDPFSPPSPEHPLGTTEYAYDILARLFYGCSTALTFGMMAIAIAAIGGIAIGTISGYYGGKIDWILMRIVEIIMVFPALILVILLVQMTGQNLMMILAFFGLLAIPIYARLMRSSVLQVKQELYIEAAKTGGAKNFKIMYKHIISNSISPVIIRFFGGVGMAILAFAGIAFLGFGDQTRPDWGTDLNYGREMISATYASIWPGLFIIITVLGFMLVGDGLRDALDPRLQQNKVR